MLCQRGSQRVVASAVLRHTVADLQHEARLPVRQSQARGKLRPLRARKLEFRFLHGSFSPFGSKAGKVRVRRCCRGAPVLSSCQDAETRAWFDTAKEDMASAAAGEKITELKTKYPVEFNFNNVVIYDLLSASVSAS